MANNGLTSRALCWRVLCSARSFDPRCYPPRHATPNLMVPPWPPRQRGRIEPPWRRDGSSAAVPASLLGVRGAAKRREAGLARASGLRLSALTAQEAQLYPRSRTAALRQFWPFVRPSAPQALAQSDALAPIPTNGVRPFGAGRASRPSATLSCLIFALSVIHALDHEVITYALSTARQSGQFGQDCC